MTEHAAVEPEAANATSPETAAGPSAAAGPMSSPSGGDSTSPSGDKGNSPDDTAAAPRPEETTETGDASAPAPAMAAAAEAEASASAPAPAPAALDMSAAGSTTTSGVETGCSSAGPGWKMGPEDFTLLCVIGQGAFGRVLQVRSKFDEEVYAMKVISKRMLKRKNHLSYMRYVTLSACLPGLPVYLSCPVHPSSS